MAFKPYLTSNELIETVKRKIMLPLDQTTFSPQDILAFVNEEMLISQVPAVMQYHEEYFVYFQRVALEANQSRYPIPNRAIGMKLRDVMWADSNNNISEMTRVNADDKAFWQRTPGNNRAFYVEGNDIVLTSGVVADPSSYLNYYYYLRPNQLVVDERSAIVECFEKKITIDNDFVLAGTTISIDDVPFTAVSTLGGTITSIEVQGTTSLITSTNHQLSSGQTVVVSGSDSSPSINGTYVVTVIDDDTFTIPKKIATNGTTGTFTCKNQFEIGATSIITAGNLATAISNEGSFISASNGAIPSAIVTVYYEEIGTEFVTESDLAYGLDDTTVGVKFETLPDSYTDPLTNVETPLFVAGTQVDFLQTNPGHRTYVFDIEIPSISSTSIYFTKTDLNYFTNTNNEEKVINFKIGDYICLSGECIIPQIPPELHPGLAERATARILAALGDREGLAVVNQKIEDIKIREGNLVDDRVTGAPVKITSRNGLLRHNKFRTNR